ncbi:MAG TPA: hypothetical protein VG273_23390 [Bryobacteraceae bacterium]|nr:hypothetical protein [Bryobacteraceae bacterium]
MKPVETLKEFAMHLFIVTLGILIALSLEGLLEWRHHTELAEEARTNIRSEIRDNEKSIDHFLKAVPEIRKKQMAVLDDIREILTRGKTKATSFELGLALAELNNTSWTTAQTVGAIGFIPYAEVKEYAGVYRLQDEFLRMQTRAEDSVVNAITLFSENQDPNKIPRPDLEAEKDKIMASITTLTAEAQIGEALDRTYKEVHK